MWAHIETEDNPHGFVLHLPDETPDTIEEALRKAARAGGVSPDTILASQRATAEDMAEEVRNFGIRASESLHVALDQLVTRGYFAADRADSEDTRNAVWLFSDLHFVGYPDSQGDWESEDRRNFLRKRAAGFLQTVGEDLVHATEMRAEFGPSSDNLFTEIREAMKTITAP